jgi:pimeloyl-ACP methyl ester carboxylesterase
MKTTNFITLPDGRKLAYAEFGKPDGYPVIYFHGGGSSLEPLLLGDELISQFGIRLIAPDRPGFGQSDFQPNRGFSDYPKDVIFLANTLGLDKFSVLGISNGGGYVSACAAKIPNRLINAVIVSGNWYMDSFAGLPILTRCFFALAKTFPLLFEIVIKLSMRPFQGSSEKLLASFKQQLPAVDYAIFQSPQRLQAVRESAIESMRQSTKNVALDVLLYVYPWDFKAAEIQIPVQFFHGEQDTKVPISMARKVVDRLPTAQLFTYPDESHISVGINQFDAIAHALKDERSNN